MWSLMIEYHGGIDPPAHTAALIDKQLEWGTPLVPDIESWGETAEAKAQAKALADMIDRL